jgi:tetratricopeptide (TPR) repeat protein
MLQASQQGSDEGRPPPGRRADWLGISACVAVCCFLLALALFKLGSVDTGYHVGYGRSFLESGEIVELDPFLYPQSARPFVNANWGSQVIMALAERAGGAAGLIGLRIVLISVIFTCIALALRHQARTPGRQSTIRNPQSDALPFGSRLNNQSAIRNPQSSIVNRQSSIALWLAWALLLAGVAAYERFSIRPELFSYAAMSILLVLLTGGLRSWRGLVAVGVLQVAWVNLHSYFLVGILLTASFLVGETLRWIWHRHKNPVPSGLADRTRLLAMALLIQTGACLVNPQHYRGAVFPLQTLGYLHQEEVMGGGPGRSGASAWSLISEFKSPFSFADEPINARTFHAYCVLLIVAGIGLAAMLAHGKLGEAVAVLALFAMSTQMRRNIAQFAFVAAPLSMAAMAQVSWRLSLRGSVPRILRSILLIATIALSARWTYGIVEGRFYYVERRINRDFGVGYNGRIFSREAVQWLAAQSDLQPNLYVNYFASSNTIPWLPDRFKLFVDTNTFAYDDSTLETAYGLGLGEIDAAQFFDEHNINVVLLRCGSSTQRLIRKLVEDYTEWALVYLDRHTVIFARRIPKHVPVILANDLAEDDLDAEAWIANIAGPAHYRAMELATAADVPMALGWDRSALSLAEAALRIAPDYSDAWHYLGVCYGNLGNEAARANRFREARRHWDRAADCFGRVLSLAPDHQDATRFLEKTQTLLNMLPE